MERINRRIITGTALIAAGSAIAATISYSNTPAPGHVIVARAPRPLPEPAVTHPPARADAALATPANAAPVLGLADSTAETFHDSDVNLCGTTKVKQDGPVRVFEDQFNVIHMTVSDANAKGWQWHGSVTGFTNNPKTALLDCTSVMTGNAANTEPGQFDQKTWIQGFYFDGTTAWAYGHEDYWGNRVDNDPDCHRSGTSDGKPGCWYAAIATWKANPVSSANRHLDFTRNGDTPDHVAIYPHVQYPGDSATPTSGWIGYGAPSNIFRGRNQDGTTDGYWYMFAYTNSGYADQPKGVCLFRSPNPADRTTWRAWNGASTTNPVFDVEMQNPYFHSNGTCAVVQPTLFNSYVRSVVWHKPSRHYVAIIRKSTGVHYATSPDLMTWSAAASLLPSTTDEAEYPVLVDFDGGDYGDDNFDRAYDNGKLYLFFRTKDATTGNLRINRRKLDVTNYPADPPGSGNPG